MTWNIRIYPLEYKAFLEALGNHETVGTEAEVEQADLAKSIVNDILDQGLLLYDGAEEASFFYDCSLTGTVLPEAASLSINLYRRRAETPQPAESEEIATAEETSTYGDG